jgi:hypothetical protein
LDWKMLLHFMYGHLKYFTDICDILWSLGTICVHLADFFRFWYHVPRKIWQPWLRLCATKKTGAHFSINFAPACAAATQGDQIRRIFASMVSVCFGKFTYADPIFGILFSPKNS